MAFGKNHNLVGHPYFGQEDGLSHPPMVSQGVAEPPQRLLGIVWPPPTCTMRWLKTPSRALELPPKPTHHLTKKQKKIIIIIFRNMSPIHKMLTYHLRTKFWKKLLKSIALFF